MQAPKSSNEVYRIFVGGLSYDVDNHVLKESFQRFSNLKKALVIRDQRSGQSKGYGFVTFSNRASFDDALHTSVSIYGRIVDCHPVLTKGALKDQEHRDVFNKLFVGGISQAVTANDLSNYFSKFGSIKESRILYDGKTGKSRGFGFILFDDSTITDVVLASGQHKINRKIVEVKKFTKEKEEELEQGSVYQSYNCHEHSFNYPPHAQETILTHKENTKIAKPKRIKSQKLKQKSIESLSTISEKDNTVNENSYSQTNDLEPHYFVKHSLEESQLKRSNDYQSSSEPNSKPNFTLSGFYANKQTFESFSLPLSRSVFGTISGLQQVSKLNLDSSSTWRCFQQPTSMQWTPASMNSASWKQSRPAQVGLYKY